MAGMDGWMVEKRPGGGHGFASKRISVNIELVGWGARGKVFGDMLMTPDEKQSRHEGRTHKGAF